jgi:hypothetical protein
MVLTYPKYKNEAFVDDSDSYLVTDDSGKDIDPSVNDEEKIISFCKFRKFYLQSSFHHSTQAIN